MKTQTKKKISWLKNLPTRCVKKITEKELSVETETVLTVLGFYSLALCGLILILEMSI